MKGDDASFGSEVVPRNGAATSDHCDKKSSVLHPIVQHTDRYFTYQCSALISSACLRNNPQQVDKVEMASADEKINESKMK